MGSKLAETIKNLLLARIESGKLKPPSMPGVAVAAMKHLKDPNAALVGIVPVIEPDPLLVAEIMRLSNTATYGSGSVTSIEQAVTRLGMKKLNTVIVEISARRMFESRDRKITEVFRSIWEHSLAVAIVARDVSALSGTADSDQVYLAGLLHDVGKPIAGNMLLDAESALGGNKSSGGWIGSDMFLETVQEIHRPIGVALAEQWKLPDSVVEGIRDCSDYDAVDRTAVPNFVRFANAIAKKQGIYAGDADQDEADALVMVGRSLLGLDDTVTNRLTEGLLQRVRAQIK